MPSWLISPLISAALLALVAGGAWYEKSAYDERRRSEGRAELLPQLKADKAAFDLIAGYMEAIKAKSEAMKNAVALAEKTNARRKNQEAARVEYVDRLVPVGNTECERVTDVITKGLRK